MIIHGATKLVAGWFHIFILVETCVELCLAVWDVCELIDTDGESSMPVNFLIKLIVALYRCSIA